MSSQIEAQSKIQNGVLVAISDLENMIKASQLDVSGVQNRVVHLEILGGIQTAMGSSTSASGTTGPSQPIAHADAPSVILKAEERTCPSSNMIVITDLMMDPFSPQLLVDLSERWDLV